MAGLGRVQMRFNATVASVLALVGFGRHYNDSAADAAHKGTGHPIHRKFLRTMDPLRATGRDKGDFLGYCAGHKERKRRFMRLLRERGIDPNDNVVVQEYLRQTRTTHPTLQRTARPRRGWKIWNLGRTA